MPDILAINPNLDRSALAAQFAADGYVQIGDVLTNDSAMELKKLLAHATPWGLVSQVGADGTPKSVRADSLSHLGRTEMAAIQSEIQRSQDSTEYAFAYLNYPLVTAYLEKWRPGSSHERLIEDLNGAGFLSLLRDISGMFDVVKADGQATLYAPGHFLWPHTDAESRRGRKVAYVLNLTSVEWRPEWGGYLSFYDSDMNIERAFRPKFNTMNLFKIPRWHSVAEVVSNAPLARYAVTGWGRSEKASG